HRKMLAARRSEINKELDKIPVRIDEAQRAMPDVAMLNADALDQQITSIKEQVEAKQAELIRIQSGGEIAVKEKRLREIEGELLTIKNDAQAAALQAISAKRQAAEALTRRADDLVFESQRIERRISENTTRIEAKKAEADRLRAEWRAAKAETFEGTHTQNTCPACGQQLPAERIAEAHRKALEAFNMSKASRLEEINRQGKATKDEIEQLVLETEELAGKLEAIHADLEIARREADAAKQELERAAAGGPDVENHPEYAAKLQEKAAVEREILGLRSSVQGTLETLRAELAKLRTELELLERDKAKIDQVEAGKRRIAELKQQEKVLAAEFEGLERQLWLTEEFIRTKVTLLESKINSKFRYARFKLFEQQINGGLEETCETLYNGVPYSSGLNRAAQINVGLDIINTLSQHYGFVAPIFIDNAEAVTELAETAGQQIRLIVSKGDKQLRIERANQTAQEATLF
ncbi:hypothetical protein ABEV74_20595, partial [Paenibacillus cisolokensis]|uniref:hypothetical protein n=1 Tax=Paenibacillus cisolokensis TaxID=1658519 RepID=UPI003D294059